MTYQYLTKYHSSTWKPNLSVTSIIDFLHSIPKCCGSYTSPLSGRTLAKESGNHISTRTSSVNLRALTQDVSELVGGDELRIVRTGVNALRLQNQGPLELKSVLANNREVSKRPTQFTK